MIELDLRARVDGFTLEVAVQAPRGPVAVVGPNGAGKSTLLRVLAGAIRPERGHVRLGGRTLCDVASRTWVPPEARRVGYLPQGYGLFEHLTVRENVGYGLRTRPATERANRTRELLAAVGVAHLEHRLPGTLSGGERQRVALARALAPEPDGLLLDEPTAAVDVAARPAVRALIGRHLRDRIAVVVTHELRDLLAWEPPLVVLLDEGRVAATGTLEALQSRDEPFLRELLSWHPDRNADSTSG